MASRAICQCLCLDKQSVSVLVCGFSWDQLCLLSPLNGRAVCKHPGIKPSGARSGPTAELPVPCVRHPLAPRRRTAAGSAFPHSRATAGTGSRPCPAHGALLSHQDCLPGSPLLQPGSQGTWHERQTAALNETGYGRAAGIRESQNHGIS